ncbi:hypothetical protein C8J57DRAFT_1489461 [Mycena rebaudengoi]|nr:hypothetical protein C8J57DRAFT_1489461 [Mycena rebaudengoi]
MPPGVPNGSEITSSALIGSLLNFLLFGMLAVQMAMYTKLFPQDRRRVKALVYAVFLMMSVSLCLNASDIHFLFATPVIGSLVGLLVQAFFAYRISMFRGARWVAGLIVLISLAQAAGGMGSGLGVYLSETSPKDSAATFVNFIRIPLLYLWLIGSAVADILIAISMTYLVYALRFPVTYFLPSYSCSESLNPSTQHIIRRVVRLIIETNALTASVAVIALAVFSGFPVRGITLSSNPITYHNVWGTTYFICPTTILPGLYSNTLLVLLNNRASPGRVVALSRDSNNASSPNAYSPNSVRLGPLTQNPRPFMIPGRMGGDKVVSPPLPPLHEDVDVQPVYSRREGNGVPRWGQTTRASLDLDEHPYGSGSYIDFR